MNRQRKCFVIMPFDAGLHFFFLHIKRHIREKHKIECERGDSRIRSDWMWGKLENQIRKADFVIADITGCNSNVLYELGFAHALNKPSIIITRDSIDDVPNDLRHRELVLQTDDPRGFLLSLNNAILNTFPNVDWFYKKGLEIMNQFKHDTGVACQLISRTLFESVFLTKVRTDGVPNKNDVGQLKYFLITLIIKDSSRIMDDIAEWLGNQ